MPFVSELNSKDRGATLKVVRLTSHSRGGGGGAKNTFFSVTLYNFLKRGTAILLFYFIK